jgi:hypothetical protein
MAGLAAASGVGAGVTHTRFQAASGGRPRHADAPLPRDVGAAALRLIHTALRPGESVGQNLDVSA